MRDQIRALKARRNVSSKLAFPIDQTHFDLTSAPQILQNGGIRRIHVEDETIQELIMNRSRPIALAGLVLCLLSVTTNAQAQFYGGGFGGYGGYGHHGGSMGSFAPPHSIGGYYPVPYSTIFPGYVGGQLPNIYGYNAGYNAGYYGIGAPAYGATYGIGAPVVVAPNPVYGTTTTIIRGGPTGGVMHYSNNGNGYSYVADSTYPTVIQQQPTLGLSRTYIPSSPPPVVRTVGGDIKLICPKNLAGGLSYSLNGNIYSIQPGYSQTFKDDRPWVLEFLRGGEGSESVRYTLKAGTYTFAVGQSGWEIHQPASAAANLPAAPLPDPGAPTAPSTIPSLPPSPLPPP